MKNSGFDKFLFFSKLNSNSLLFLEIKFLTLTPLSGAKYGRRNETLYFILICGDKLRGFRGEVSAALRKKNNPGCVLHKCGHL